MLDQLRLTCRQAGNREKRSTFISPPGVLGGASAPGWCQRLSHRRRA